MQRSNVSKMENVVFFLYNIMVYFVWYFDILGFIRNKGYLKRLGSSKNIGLGWFGQKEGNFNLDVRRLRKGMFEILKIMNSLDSVSMECVI